MEITKSQITYFANQDVERFTVVDDMIEYIDNKKKRVMLIFERLLTVIQGDPLILISKQNLDQFPKINQRIKNVHFLSLKAIHLSNKKLIINEEGNSKLLLWNNNDKTIVKLSLEENNFLEILETKKLNFGDKIVVGVDLLLIKENQLYVVGYDQATIK